MKFVHIAGTNGKGSAAAYISRIITAAEKRCGSFTSPHLISPVERFQIDGQCIDTQMLDSLMQEVAQNRLAVNDTLFAAYTAAALLCFERSDVEYAVMETGLGGRLDPTNSIAPDITVLTSISIDHTDILGSRIEDIAAEKCGIIKPGVPVVSAAQNPIVRDIIARYCSDIGSPLHFADDIKLLSQSVGGQNFETGGHRYNIRAIGTAQPQNAALAVWACRILGFDETTIAAGLEATVLVARTQYIPGRPDILLDGAHNPASAAMLAETLDKYFYDRRKVLLFACMKNKDYRRIIDILGRYFERVITTRIGEKRGVEASDICMHFQKNLACEAYPNFNRAFDRARDVAAEDDVLLVITGSLYLAGAVWHRLQHK